LIFVIIEVSTLEFTFLMLAIGSLGGLLTGLIGFEVWAQVITAAVISVLLLFVLKPPLVRRLHRGGDETPTLVDALIGIDGVVSTDFASGRGQVKLANGETWTARLSPVTEQRDVDSGERIIVTAIDGATAVVVPTERN